MIWILSLCSIIKINFDVAIIFHLLSKATYNELKISESFKTNACFDCAHLKANVLKAQRAAEQQSHLRNWEMQN